MLSCLFRMTLLGYPSAVFTDSDRLLTFVFIDLDMD